MPLDMTPQQRDLGKANFQQATEGLSRRGFMKSVLAGTAVPATAAAYFGYEYSQVKDKPVRAALIGAGDEGGVLVGEHNPHYLEFVAYSDIRPSNRDRIFKGQPNTPRKGFNFHYGPKAADKIKLFPNYRDMLADESLGIEAVVIALPLHLHAPVSIDCLNAGKHVLCEKLMAWNVDQCKKMIQAADKAQRILCIGHQRHYSMLYAQANEVLKAGVLGDIRHIRALWHRNNTWPEVDAHGRVIPGSIHDAWKPDINAKDRAALEKEIANYDYKSMEELVRWRLFNRTGAGLMAELGSHQLDACSIFLGKVHPLAVSGVGGKMFYTDDREVEDHVFVTFEFPGQKYYNRDANGAIALGKDHKPAIKNPKDTVVVSYSSINTNGFEGYGECLLGTRGSMVVSKEQEVMLYAEPDRNVKGGGAARATSVTVTSAGANAPVLDTSATSGPVDTSSAPASGGGSVAAGPVSRGYREEMEHFAYCVRMFQKADDKDKAQWLRTPRCRGRVAMADAIIALTSNEAMRQQKRIEFRDEWFDANSSEVPDADMKPLHSDGKEVRL